MQFCVCQSKLRTRDCDIYVSAVLAIVLKFPSGLVVSLLVSQPHGPEIESRPEADI